MREDKQDKAGDGSPAITPGGNTTVEHSLTQLARTGTSSETKLSLLARVFEPLLYPFAVIALRILTNSTRRARPQN